MNSAGTSWSEVIKQAVGKHQRDPPTSDEDTKSALMETQVRREAEKREWETERGRQMRDD